MGVACCKPEVIDFEKEGTKYLRLVELKHFELMRSVGKGAFGKVRIVQHKLSKELYALKYINKEKCAKMKATQNIIEERMMLQEINCPFVCNLRYAFQDDENMFMVIDLMLGGDLRFHLDKSGHLTEDQVRFYMAECSLGLAFLHSKNIIHRDLKPDNILLDKDGHACLTDFNIAVKFSEDKPLTAIAGSMAYMAPEILAKKGYSNHIDWWSLGVIQYELLFGKRPFRGGNNNELAKAILTEKLEFPSMSGHVSPECISCIKGFITRNIKNRLGVNGGFGKIRSHDWFSVLNWEKLEDKTATAPFIPNPKEANFDATHELEEILLEDNPLKAKPRKTEEEKAKMKIKVDPKLEKDYQLMDEKFTVFDFTKSKLENWKKSALNLASNNNASTTSKSDTSQTDIHSDFEQIDTDDLSFSQIETSPTNFEPPSAPPAGGICTDFSSH